MPTNFFRSDPAKGARSRRRPVPVERRRIRLSAAGVTLELKPSATRTAELIWEALPLHSILETWGDSLHFEIPVRAPRDRTARMNGRATDAYYWADDERVVICWGPTPISRPGEIRLMRPCNIWAEVLGDPQRLRGIGPGTKVRLEGFVV